MPLTSLSIIDYWLPVFIIAKHETEAFIPDRVIKGTWESKFQIIKLPLEHPVAIRLLLRAINLVILLLDSRLKQLAFTISILFDN